MINHSVMNLGLADIVYFQLPITNRNNKFWFSTKNVCFVCKFKLLDHMKYFIFEAHITLHRTGVPIILCKKKKTTVEITLTAE